jgi:hypothetical protein
MGDLTWDFGPNDTDIGIAREETINGYRICEFMSGGVRVTKDDYWAWSYPGDFEADKKLAESLS